MWEDEIEIGESLEPEAEKSNIRKGHHIIIIIKQFVMQEVKGIPLGNRT